MKNIYYCLILIDVIASEYLYDLDHDNELYLGMAYIPVLIMLVILI
jgi:hypothetical protein